jgi:hypothetical protein
VVVVVVVVVVVGAMQNRLWFHLAVLYFISITAYTLLYMVYSWLPTVFFYFFHLSTACFS